MIQKDETMKEQEKRNLGGSILCFLSSCLFGGLAIAFWMLREVHQSNKYGFAVEKDDIVRYSIVGAIGGIIHDVTILIIMKGGI